MKKVLSMLLALTMVLSMFSTAAFAEGEVVDGDTVVSEDVVVDESSEEDILPEAPISDNLIYGLLPSDADSVYPTSFSYLAQKDPAVLTDGAISTDEDSYKANYSFNNEQKTISFAYLCDGISFKEVNVASHQPADLAVKGLKSVKVEVLIDGEWLAAGTADNLPAGAAGTIYALTSNTAITADGVRVSFTINSSGSGYNTAAISEIQVFADVQTENAVGALEVNLAKMETPALTIADGNTVAIKAGKSVTFDAVASVTDGGTLSYQWYKDDEAIAGAVDPLYSVFNAEAGATYKVVVTNSGANNPAKAEAEVELVVEGETTNLAVGKSYEWISSPYASYPDTDNKEMTDGVIPAVVDFGQAGYVGTANNGALSYTIDLGELCTVEEVAAVFMSTGSSGLSMGDKLEVTYSTNGAIWNDFGEWSYSNKTVKGQLVANVEAVEPVVAQYITITAPGTTGMHFMAEGMVYGTTGAEGGEVVREGNLVKGARWTTNIPEENFVYGNGPAALPDMVNWLTDGEYARDTAYSTTAGIVGFNTTGYLEFNAGENVEFNYIALHTAMKQSFAADYSDYQDIVIEAYKDGVWYKLNAPTDLAYEAQKTYYFVADEPITASKFRFNIVGRKGLYVTSFTEFEVFAEAYEGAAAADIALVMPEVTVAVPSVEITNGDEMTIALNDYVTFNSTTTTTGEGGTLTYQWYKDGVALTDGAYSIYTIKGTEDAAGTYKLVVTSMDDTGVAYTSASDEIVVTVDGELENRIAGSAYEYEEYETNVVVGNANYADTDLKELTDGNVPTEVSYGNAGYVGFGAYKTIYLTFDLGEYPEPFEAAKMVFMSTNNSGIKLPSALRISVRDTLEESWRDVGTWAVPDQNVAGIQVADVNFEEPIEARYVRFYSYNGGMAFASEVMLLGAPVVAEEPVLNTEFPREYACFAGETITIDGTATVTDGGTLTYQWYKDYYAIEGETGEKLVIENASAEDNGIYNLIVTNTHRNGTVATHTTYMCEVLVEDVPVYAELPVITTQLPTAKALTVGDALELVVEASVNDGGTLSYQWYKDDVAIEGANDTSYTIDAVALTDAGSYYVEITNSVENGEDSVATSMTCAVTVEEPVVTGYKVSGNLTKSGSTAAATIELIADGTVVASTTVEGKTGAYELTDVVAGTYTLKVTKSKHVAREYTVEVVDADVAQDVQVWLYGDVTADGIVNNTDVIQINRRNANQTSVFSQVNADSDYRMVVANVTAITGTDKIVNNTDVIQINRKNANQTSVFDRLA